MVNYITSSGLFELLPGERPLFFDIAELFPNAADEIDSHTRHLTVIDDNKTRWNSTYLTIHRALCLRHRIKKLYTTHFSKDKDFPSSDILSEADWEELAIFKGLLDPFTGCIFGYKAIIGRAHMVQLGNPWCALISSKSISNGRKWSIYGSEILDSL